MKKLLQTLSVIGMFTLTSQATVILNDTFTYSDGPLAGPGNVSSSAWFTHSGAVTGQVDVASGKVNLTQTETEDVSQSLTGAPYSGVYTLYMSMVVNFSALPAGSGAYFFNFRDTGVSNLKGRLWVTPNGANYRVGIANGGNTPVYITTDLALNSDAKLVMRVINGTNYTLWINPTSESSIVNKADGTDSTGAAPLSFACFRQAGSNPGMGVLTVDDLLVGTTFSDVQTVGGPPSISGLTNVSISATTSTGPLGFVVSDVETPAASLTVAATSDNPTLVPNNPANLTFAGSGANRTLNVTPAASQQGTANIAVVVTDGSSLTATNTFTITVGLPTISSMTNQIALTNTVTGPLVFTVNDSETAPGSLTVTATSSDQAVLPDANIRVINGGGTRSLYLTNIAAGFSTVTVNVNDTVFNVSTSFVLTAYPTNGILLADDFGYTDGSITTNSTFLWATHSATTGQTGQTQVITGKLFLTNSASEDINRWFTNAPIATNSGQLVFTRFVVNLISLPTANGVGEYFTHVYGLSGGFRARVFASTNGAASGKFRLAISSSSFTPSVFPQDLSLNQSYVVISRYNTATAEAALWVNPASESSQSVYSTDVSTPVTAYGIAFRQSTGIGTMSIDDLIMGSTFPDVFLASAPAPIALNIQPDGGNVVLSWADPAFALQAAPFATGTYTNVPGATSPYTNAANAAEKYFRLKY